MMKYLIVAFFLLMTLVSCSKNVGYNHSATCHRIAAEMNAVEGRGNRVPPHTAVTQARWAQTYHRLGCQD